MKANEAPERIWINSPQDLPCGTVDSNSVEYTRTDAFIEKACDWLEKNCCCYRWDDSGLPNRDLIEDFRKYMEE